VTLTRTARIAAAVATVRNAAAALSQQPLLVVEAVVASKGRSSSANAAMLACAVSSGAHRSRGSPRPTVRRLPLARRAPGARRRARRPSAPRIGVPPRSTSGARYAGVPTTPPAAVSPRNAFALRDAEVGDLRMPEPVDQDVLGLDVAVHDSVRVREGERLAHLEHVSSISRDRGGGDGAPRARRRRPCSIAKYGIPSISPTSCTESRSEGAGGAPCAALRARTARRSPVARRAPRRGTSLRRSDSIATSRARQTVPMPPRPDPPRRARAGRLRRADSSYTRCRACSATARTAHAPSPSACHSFAGVAIVASPFPRPRP
jgi:hypothetical protein